MQGTFAFVRQSKKYIVELNLFEDEASRSNLFNLRTAILSTRVYIILLVISVITLVVFNALGTQPEVITILNPSEADYTDFLKIYGNSSLCPCNRVNIPYDNFTLTTVKYHPVCSSVFVSNDWINYLFNPKFTSIYQGDFRALANNYFQLLATFCSYANRSINDALNNFHSQTLLTPDVLLPNSLNTQIAEKGAILKSITANSVTQLLQLVRTTTQSNGLQTAISLSAIMYLPYEDEFLRKRDTIFNYTGSSSCYCTSARSCSVPSGFFDISKRTEETIYLVPNFPRLANVSGFYVGCFPLESLLQSTLECLFDSSCLKTIRAYILSSNITDVYALNISQTPQFPPNTSIEELINKLFIQEWSMKANFSNYYTQCAPILCTHTREQRNNALYVLTKLLGVYGGLRAILYLCVPLIVAWYRKRKIIDSAEPRPSEYIC